MPNAPDTEQPRWPLIGRLVLQAHLVLAVGWWLLMPGGFPAGHPRFLVNQVFPWVILAVGAIGQYASLKRRWRIYHAVLIGLAAMWASALITATVLFPVSAPRFLAGAFLPALALLAICAFTLRRAALFSLPTTITTLVLVAVGVALPFTQRGGPPRTEPRGGELPEVQSPEESPLEPGHQVLTEDLSVSPTSGAVNLDSGRITIGIESLLTFDSRSPDRCWTIFAPSRRRRRIPRALTAADLKEGSCLLNYGGRDSLEVRTTEPPGSCRIEAFTRLDKAVYSHLNTFCELSIVGHERLWIEFSPCPGTRVEVKPADYPTGRPLQAAYVDRERAFHIVRAATGEKGPFERITSGRLARDEPLTLTLYDDDRLVCQIEFEDWAAQASTSLSPTAGWGFPENAIEFRLTGNAPSSPANIWLTLAGTSVGRGWDSVGHAAGVYRNRMTVTVPEESD